VQASDNVGVTSVSGSYTTSLPNSPLKFMGAGTTWTATFGPFGNLPQGYDQPIAITITARDAAGNVSQPVTINIQVIGTCLI
jgi:hypothetical protein